METKIWTFDFSLVSENDSRVVSNEYSAYPEDKTNKFPVMQTSYRDHVKINQNSGVQSSFLTAPRSMIKSSKSFIDFQIGVNNGET